MALTDAERHNISRNEAYRAMHEATNRLSAALAHVRNLPKPRPTERIEAAIRELELARDELRT